MRKILSRPEYQVWQEWKWNQALDIHHRSPFQVLTLLTGALPANSACAPTTTPLVNTVCSLVNTVCQRKILSRPEYQVWQEWKWNQALDIHHRSPFQVLTLLTGALPANSACAPTTTPLVNTVCSRELFNGTASHRFM